MPAAAPLSIRDDASLVPSGAALARVAVLAPLAAPRLDALAARCRWQHLAPWEPLDLREAGADAAHLLVAGRMRLSLRTAEGVQVDLQEIGGGDLFGEWAAAPGAAAPPAEGVALSRCLVATLDGACFRALLEEEPRVALRCAGSLAAQLRQLSEQVLSLHAAR